MIDVTRLMSVSEGSGPSEDGPPLRFPLWPGLGHTDVTDGPPPGSACGFSVDTVVWRCTCRCNLNCARCYTSSGERRSSSDDEMTTGQGRLLIRQLAESGVRVLVFAGGEPLVRDDLPVLCEEAVRSGLVTVVRTNGTLIDVETARSLRKAGVSRVSIALEGLGRDNDRRRGEEGAFKRVLSGLRACREAGLPVGLSYSMTRFSVGNVTALFDFAREKAIETICFEHLVPPSGGVGRGNVQAMAEPLDVRSAVSRIFEMAGVAGNVADTGSPVSVFTDGNGCDGVYLYIRALRRRGRSAPKFLLRCLEANARVSGPIDHGGNVAAVDWLGFVRAGSLRFDEHLGNIRDASFHHLVSASAADGTLISYDESIRSLRGRCGRCSYAKACGGGNRTRALSLAGNCFAADKACYLGEDELAEQD